MRTFHTVSLATLIAVYVLILVGGIVRSSGSGMGCPDWPKCFGQWVPPTSVEQLPEDYKEFYAAYRHKKNVRFAKYLRTFGMAETADMLMADESVLIETDFNATKTWVEYVNRLVGVVIGFLIFVVALLSLKYWKTNMMLTVVGIVSFVLVGFQGWIGSFVVSTNLTPWTITLHMLLALVLVLLLVYLVFRSGDHQTYADDRITLVFTLACMAVLLVQIVLGTQVREAIDTVARSLPRTAWIEAIGADFIIHRSFSWVVLFVHVGLVWKLVKSRPSKAFPLALILLILGTIVSGTGMAYMGVPPLLQPVHLTLATVTFGLQAFLLMQMLNKRTITAAGA